MSGFCSFSCLRACVCVLPAARVHCVCKPLSVYVLVLIEDSLGFRPLVAQASFCDPSSGPLSAPIMAAPANTENTEQGRNRQALCHAQDTRLMYMEAYTKVDLRGFSAVSDFLKDKDRDFKLAKQAFIASFMTDLEDKAFPEATHVIEETESFLCEAHGVVVVGIFPTGGQLAPRP